MSITSAVETQGGGWRVAGLRRAAARPIAALLATTASLALGASDAAASCAPLPCSQVIVSEPYNLSFDRSHGGVVDSGGKGTGFTYVDHPSAGGGYAPGRLSLGDGFLTIRTGPGINHAGVNSVENGLAVGVSAGTNRFTLQTTLDRPPLHARRWEQGGLWIGTDDDKYVKLVAVSGRHGPIIQLLGEKARGSSGSGGVTFASRSVGVPVLERSRVTLALRVDTEARTVTGRYALDEGELHNLGTLVVPRDLLSREAGTEPALAGSRFAGVFATHRRAPGPLAFRFGSFALCRTDTCSGPDPEEGGGSGPDPQRPGSRPKRPQRPGSDAGGRRRDVRVRRSIDGLTASLRHPRRIRISRLIARGLRLRLRCSDACNVKGELLGSGGWARSRVSNSRRSPVRVGLNRARLRTAGSLTMRVHIKTRLKSRLRRAMRARLVIRAQVRGAQARPIRLRSVVIARR